MFEDLAVLAAHGGGVEIVAHGAHLFLLAFGSLQPRCGLEGGLLEVLVERQGAGRGCSVYIFYQTDGINGLLPKSIDVKLVGEVECGGVFEGLEVGHRLDGQPDGVADGLGCHEQGVARGVGGKPFGQVVGLLADAVDVHGLADGDGLAVAEDGNLALFAVAHAVGHGGDAVDGCINTLRHLDREQHLRGILDGDVFGVEAQRVARSGIGEQQLYLHGYLSTLRFHYFGHKGEAVALAEEAGHVGLHHEGFGGDKGFVEGADFEVAAHSEAADVPAREEFGNGEAVGGGAGAVGAHVGGEECQGAEVLAQLHLGVVFDVGLRDGFVHIAVDSEVTGKGCSGFVGGQRDTKSFLFLGQFRHRRERALGHNPVLGKRAGSAKSGHGNAAIARQSVDEGPHRGVGAIVGVPFASRKPVGAA